ncbi:hypothetical protein FGIG_10551 [Fasciola gigantica]|uniref:C2H2-type domain-containing protein n=1 Tax=Fasciola gigantica TaxID=46835 RepID=A0A504YAW1_FASGI|nr:hypothetical protein FGIG_10551 [Fasciola gigantica]
MNTSVCVLPSIPVTPSGATQTNLRRVSDAGNILKTLPHESCLTPQLNYIPPGLHCQLSDSGDFLEVCASGRFAAGHVWGPYLIHLTAECRQRLRTADDQNSSLSFNIAVKNDGSVADPHAIVLGEEHTWIKLLYESGLRSPTAKECEFGFAYRSPTFVCSHLLLLLLLFFPLIFCVRYSHYVATSKTITLVVTTEIAADDSLRGTLRIRTANSASPTQRNDPGSIGVLSSLGAGNGSINLKPAVHLSPGSHSSSSPVSAATTGLGVVTASGASGVSTTGTISTTIGSVVGPKRDKKCTYCGIPFSNLDTLNAHMTHYCSRRPQISHVPGAASSVTASNAISSSAIALDSGITTTSGANKSSGSSSGSRSGGSKRPVSQNGTATLVTTSNLNLVNELSAYTGQLPLFAGISFDKLNALSALAGPLGADVLSTHLDYADLPASLLQSLFPATFYSAEISGGGTGSGNVGGSNVSVTSPGGGVVADTSGGHDQANTIRASVAATMLPYLTRLLPPSSSATLSAPVTSTSTAPKSEISSSQSTKLSDNSSIQTSNTTKSTTNTYNQPVDLDHGEKRPTTQPFVPTESSLPEICHASTVLSERLISSPLYCNGCQRFFASGQLYSCHLQMSYRLLKTGDSGVISSASLKECADRKIDNDTGNDNAFHLATAASRLGLVLAAPLVTTNGIHYVPVHPSCGTQFEQINNNPSSNANSGLHHPYSHVAHLSQANATGQKLSSQAVNTSCHTPKHCSPGVHSTKSVRDFSAPVDHGSTSVKPETVNPSSSVKQSIVVQNAPSKILDLSYTPQTMISSIPDLGRDAPLPPLAFQTDQATPADGSTLTQLPISSGLSGSPGAGSMMSNSPAASSIEFSPYANLLQLFIQLMTTGAAESNEPEASGSLNLSQLMAQLYSTSSLYGPLAAAITNPANSVLPTLPSSASATTPASSTPLIPFFAPFWLAQGHDGPLGGLVGSPRTTSHVSQTPPTSPIRDPKLGANPIGLLASMHSSHLSGNSIITGRAELNASGKSAKTSGTVNSIATPASGQTTLPNQTSPTGSPESPSCRPFLCTYCQTRFQAYTTYMAHQDIYCQARREALKNIRVSSDANSTSSGNSSSNTPVPVTGSSSPTSFLSNKRRRIHSPGLITDTSKQLDANISTRCSLPSPNTSSASGGSGDDDPEVSSLSGVKSDSGTVRRVRFDDASDSAPAELSESSCLSSGLQWEVCGSTELRCSACGYVGQTARGMKMHKRLHDCNGTVSR